MTTKERRKEIVTALEELLRKSGEWMFFDNRNYLSAIAEAVTCLRAMDEEERKENMQKKYAKYQGKNVSEFRRISEKSRYNKNYYEAIEGDVLLAESDDDNYTAYYLNGEINQFAESFANGDDNIDLV